MSLRPIGLRSRQLLLRSEPCIFCQSRQFHEPLHCYASQPTTSIFNWETQTSKRRQWSRNYATGNHMTPQQVRVEIDKQNRLGHLKATAADGRLAMKVPTADEIIADALLSRGKGESLDAVSLAKKYKVDVEDITVLAMAVHRIPDIQDKTRLSRMPPSIHKPISSQLLLACSKAKDPLAIMHILSAVLYSTTHANLNVRRVSSDIASLFKSADIAYCRKELEVLASKNDADAMNLLGQLLEREGQTQQARTLYEKALERANTKFIQADPKTLFLSLVPVWNALGYLLLADKDPKVREQARAAFEKGALKADDPLSYYHLASFQPDKSANWLKYMSKAAASGHREAMHEVANFYLDVNSDSGAGVKPSILKDRQLATPLTWLTWKRDSPKDLAEEWFGVAAERGYKPAMLELVKLHESKGDIEKTKSFLRKMTEPLPAGEVEEWPRLVEEARKRLRS